MRKVLLLLMLFTSISFSLFAQFPAPYCNVVNANDIEPITLVNFAGINQTTANTVNAPSVNLVNYTAVMGTVGQGVAYPITLKGNTNGSFTTVFRAYIDWNQDNDFLDAGESFDLGSVANSTGLDAIQLVSSILVPATATLGTTRMRIMKKYNSYPVDACTNTWGQAQDYTLTITLPPPSQNIVSTGVGGLWSATTTWVGGIVPISVDNVTIVNGSTVTIDVSPVVKSLTVGQGVSGILNFDATAGRTLTVSETFTTAAGSTFTPYTATTGRTINLNGNVILNGTSDFSYASTGVVLQGTAAQTISGSGDLGTGSAVRFISFANAAGVTLSRPITVTQQINLAGPVTNGTNLTLDNTVGAATPPTAVLLQKGSNHSFSSPILVGATATYNVSFLLFTGQPSVAATEGNIIPASRTINALTINNINGVTLTDNLTCGAATTALTLTSGILTVPVTKSLTFSNASYNGVVGSATSFVNGTVALSIVASATKTYPIGSAGQNRRVILTTAVGTNAVVSFGIVAPSGGTNGTGINALTSGRRWYGQVVSGTLTSFGTISIAYGTDDGFGSATDADKRIAQAATLSGTYNSVGPATGTTTPLVSTASTATVGLGYFALGLATGVLPITWDGGASNNNWFSALNWSNDAVPTANDDLIIGSSYTVSVGAAGAVARGITISAGGKLMVVANGDLEVGPFASEGGGNKAVLNSGTLEITGGLMKVAGYLNTGGIGSDFKMSGGELKIDGSGSVSSVIAAQIPFMLGNGTNISTSTVTGGKITIIDPHPVAATKVFQFNNPAGVGNDATWTGNTIQFGEIGSNASSSTNNFVVDLWTATGFLQLGNVIIETNGGTTGCGLLSSYQFAVNGNLTIKANSNFAPGTSAVALNGNLIVEAGATMTAVSLIKGILLGQNNSGTLANQASSAPSSITNNGTIRESITSTCTECLVALTLNTSTTGANVVLNSPITATGTLTLTSGNIVSTSTNLLTLGVISPAAAGTLTNTAGSITGPFKRVITATTGARLFPVGSVGIAKPANINFTVAPSSAGTLTAEFKTTAPGGNGLPLNDASVILNAVAQYGYWSIVAGDGLADGTYSIDLTGTGFGGITTPAELRVIKRAAAASPWALEGTHIAGTGVTASRSGLTSFSEFAIASASTSNTLPVSIVNFKGDKQGNMNLLTWTTLNEINNSGFELLRSADGINFSSLGFVATKATNGNSVTNINYDLADFKPLIAASYYRLKQIDKDGKSTLSNIVLIKGNKVNSLMLTSIYPNPAIDKLNMIVASPKADKVTFIVSDLTGKVIMSQLVNVSNGDNTVQMNVALLAKGIYSIKAICADGCETAISRFVKQ